MINSLSRGGLIAGLLLCAPATAFGPPGTVTPVGQWDMFGGTYGDVWGDGDWAYVGHFGGAGVNIIDISDPADPVGFEYMLPFPHTSASAQDIKVGDGLLFIGLESSGSGSVHIVDVRDPLSPVPVVDIIVSGFAAIHNVFYDNGFLYMADSGSTRVGIFDLTGLDPDNPPGSPITATTWTLENVGSAFVHDMTVANGRLYACAWDSGLWIYDVTNVATEIPTLLGSTPGNNTHSAWPTADGNYVVTGEERDGGGIQVYRITETRGSLTLELTDSFAVSPLEAFSVHNQIIDGYRLYNAWYSAGMKIFDIDPDTGLLSLFAEYDPGGSMWGVYSFLGPGRVLLSNMQSGLHVVSVEPFGPGDADGDGEVGIQDFLLVIGNWGECPDPCPPLCPGDVDGDCEVGIEDFLIVIGNWTG